MASSKIKGITIEIDGNTSKLQDSLKDVDKQLKTTQSELKQVDKLLKLDPKNTTLLAQKQKLLGDTINTTKERLKTLSEAKKQLDERLRSGVEEKNEEAYRELEREIASTTASLKKQNEEWQKNFSLTGKMGSQLQNASQSFKQLGDTLKPLSVAATAVLGSLTAITTKAIENADTLNTLSRQYDLTTDQLQKFQLASGLIDVDLSTITRSYSRLTKAMTSGSKDVAAAFDTLNVNVKDSNGELRSVDDVFNDVIASLGTIQNETEQDALAMTIFGKSANELGTLINGGSEQLAEFSKYLEENGLILSQDELNTLNDTNDALDTIKATLQAVSQRVALDFAPIFTKVFSTVNGLILGFKKRWDELSPTFKENALKITTLVTTLSPLLLGISKISGSLGGLLKNLGTGEGLSGVMGGLLNPTTLLIGGLTALFVSNEDFRNSVIELVKEIADRVAPIIEKVWKFISESILPVLQKIGEAVIPVLTQALDTVGDVLDVIFTVLEDLWTILEDTGVLDAFGLAFEKVGEIIEGVVGWIKDAFKWVSDLIEKVNELNGGDGSKYAYDNLINSGYVPYGSGGFGYASGGMGVTLNASFTINNGANIGKNTVQGWAREMVDIINIELGRRI